MWAYRKQAGEPQLTFNHVAALSNYLTNFTFSKGITFKVDKSFQHMTPALLDRIFDQDNNRQQFLWGMGQQGGVSGDCFVKVAYAEPGTDAADPISGRGRVLLLVLQPSHSFPIWHPHIPGKMTEFKLKYKFFGTQGDGTRVVNTYCEHITNEFIKEYLNDELIRESPNMLGRIPIVHIANTPVSGSPWGLSDIDGVIPLNREYNEKATEISEIINYHCVDSETEILTRQGWKRHTDLSTADDVLTLNPETDDIEWNQIDSVSRFKYSGNLIRWDNHIDALTTPNHRWLVERRYGRDRQFIREIARTSDPEDGDNSVPKLTQASKIIVGGGTPLAFASEPKWSDELVETVGWYLTEGSDQFHQNPGRFHSALISQSAHVNPQKVADIRRLRNYWWARGATFTEHKPRANGVITWYLGRGVIEALEDSAPGKRLTPEFVSSLTYHQAQLLRKVLLDGDGTRAGHGGDTWYQDDGARKDGYQMLCAMLGIRTRKYDHLVSEYLRRSILAKETSVRAVEEKPAEPMVWCPTVRNGIWMARRGGITYWTGNTAPVTIVTGGKPPNLEKGPAKIWGIPNEKASVFNLEGGAAGLAPALEYLEMLRMRMHEYGHVPANALGEEQAISNTSGVALAIQFMPTMMWYGLKKIQFGAGLREICQLALMTLFMKEPEALIYDPNTDGVLDPMLGQQPVISPDDPAVYDIEINWPAPLPTDVIIKLDEIERKMGLNLESRKGALRDLNEEFPDEKILELEEELMSDAKTNASLTVFKAQVAAAVMELTGVIPPEMGEPVPPEAPEPGSSASGSDAPQQVTRRAPTLPPGVSSMSKEVMSEIVTNAFMPRVPLRRQVDKNDS